MTESTPAKVYCIGIGGIGVSALAMYHRSAGAKVSGSDRSASHVTEWLGSKGVSVHIGQDAAEITPDIDLVIYTIAIPDDNPQLVRARELGLRVLTYPEALGEITLGTFTFAVSGTHGKTTTTAMLIGGLAAAGKKPTGIVGSLLSEYNSNYVEGSGDYMVIEACEYRRSFLNYHPNVLVITNIEADHLDYYHDLADIQDAFRELISNMPEDGVVICNPASEAVRGVVENCGRQVIDYMVIPDAGLDLQLPGDHNRQNAKAAIAASLVVSDERDLIMQGVNSFTGTWRRFEYKGDMTTGARVYDDYAHHPTEIRAMLAGAREKYPDRKIIVAFESHMYSRTELLLDEFAASFDDADEVVVLPIYRARGDVDTSITTEKLTEEINKHHDDVVLQPGFAEAKDYLLGSTKEGDIVVTAGAGTVTELGNMLVAE